MKLQGLAGIILAAGASSRMGADKALLKSPGGAQNFVTAQIASLRPHCELILVVAGRNAEDLKHSVYAAGADLVVNRDPDRGQFSSLQTGLHELLNRGRDIALVTHVDVLPASSATLEGLKARFLEERPRKWLVVPAFEGQHGHPVLAGREMIEAWLRAAATSTAREVEHAQGERVAYLPVEDASVIVNINTREDYDRLQGKK